MSTPPPGRWACRLVEAAAQVLPAGQRERYAREFVSELYGLPRHHQLRHACQVLAHAWALRTVLASTTSEETAMTSTTGRPLRCRLHLHQWDERENPETRERYEICLRCDAYRERPRAAPGAGAAGAAGGGMP